MARHIIDDETVLTFPSSSLEAKNVIATATETSAAITAIAEKITTVIEEIKLLCPSRRRRKHIATITHVSADATDYARLVQHLSQWFASASPTRSSWTKYATILASRKQFTTRLGERKSKVDFDSDDDEEENESWFASSPENILRQQNNDTLDFVSFHTGGLPRSIVAVALWLTKGDEAEACMLLNTIS